MAPPLLQVEDLTVEFRGDAGWLRAVEGVSFTLGARESLGLVGESGSGKSVTALSLLRLHARRTTRLPTGRVLWQGRDLLGFSEREIRAIRGKDIAMIFQDPMTSLNPVLTIADPLGETLRIHQGLDPPAAPRPPGELPHPAPLPPPG